MESIEIYNDSIDLVDLDIIVKAVRAGVESNEFEAFERLGEGVIGIVRGYKDYAIKMIKDCPYDEEDEDLAEIEFKDAEILKSLQELESIPKIYAKIDDKAIIVEKITGMTVCNFVGELYYNKIHNYINEKFLDVYNQELHNIFKLGYIPADLHSSNVMVCEKTGLPKIIDVGCFIDIRDKTPKYDKNDNVIPERYTYLKYAYEHIADITKDIVWEKRKEFLLACD